MFEKLETGAACRPSSCYILIGVSSVFDRNPSAGGRYTQGTYRLQIALQ